MDIETCLDAMEAAREAYTYCHASEFDKRLRQYHKFRARILWYGTARSILRAKVNILETILDIKKIEDAR